MPTDQFTPTVDELGQFMRARTKTRYGQTVGTFNDSTPVTAEQAQGLIQEAVDETALAVGSDLPAGPDGDPDLFTRGAKAVALLLASMNVELTLAPEQVSDPRSPYAALERRVNSLTKRLIEAVTEARGGTEGGESDTGVVNAAAFGASGTFPPPMTTLDERF